MAAASPPRVGWLTETAAPSSSDEEGDLREAGGHQPASRTGSPIVLPLNPHEGRDLPMQNHPSDQSPADATHGKALVLLLLCVVLSVLANVYVADTDLIGRLAHAWPPIALALTAHIVWVVRGRSRWVTAITVALLVLVAAVAGAISYVGLQALATAANMSPLAAAWFPLTVDGLGLAAGIAFAAGSTSRSSTTILSTGDKAEQVLAHQEDLDDQAVVMDQGAESGPPALSAVSAPDREFISQEREAAVTEDSHEVAAEEAWAVDHDIPDVDRQVQLVVQRLREDPDLRAEEVQLFIPGVSSLRTAQRRLQAARQVLQEEDGRTPQLVSIS